MKKVRLLDSCLNELNHIKDVKFTHHKTLMEFELNTSPEEFYENIMEMKDVTNIHILFDRIRMVGWFTLRAIIKMNLNTPDDQIGIRYELVEAARI